MSDDTPQLQVQVDVTANAAPAQQVADALGGVKQAAGEASTAADKHTDAMDKMGQGAVGAGHVLRGLEMAGQGSARGLFSAAQGARHLMDSFGMGALGPLALFIGGISAGVMTLIKLFQDSKKEAEKLNAESAKLAVETQNLINLRLQSRVDEYAQMAKYIEAAATAQEKFNSARLKALDARTSADLAKLDLEESQAMLKLKPNDKIGRDRTRLEYAEKRSDLQSQAEISKADQELKDANQKAVSTKESAEHIEQQAALQLQVYEALKHEDAARKGIVRNLDVLNEEINAAKAKPLEARSMGDMEKIALGSERRKKFEGMLSTKRPQADIDKDIRESEKKMEDLEAQYNEKQSARRLAEYETVPPTLRAEEVRTKAKTTVFRHQDESAALSYEEQQRAAEAARAKQLADLERQKDAATERERANKDRLQQAQRGEAPEELAALHAAASGARINLAKTTQDLIQSLVRATEDDARQKQQLIEQIRSLRERQENTITN